MGADQIHPLASRASGADHASPTQHRIGSATAVRAEISAERFDALATAIPSRLAGLLVGFVDLVIK